MTHTPSAPDQYPLRKQPPEGPPRLPEDLTTTQVYAAATAVLLTAPYYGDAHHRQCNALLGSGNDTLVLNDYDSWSSSEFEGLCASPREQRELLKNGEAVITFDFYDPDGGPRDFSYTCAWIDDDSFRPDSPLGSQLDPYCEAAGALAYAFNRRHGLNRSFNLLRSMKPDADLPAVLAPSTIRQRREIDTIDAKFSNDNPLSKFLQTVAEWPADQPAIIRTGRGKDGIFTDSLIANPHNDIRLFGAYQALMSILQS